MLQQTDEMLEQIMLLSKKHGVDPEFVFNVLTFNTRKDVITKQIPALIEKIVELLGINVKVRFSEDGEVKMDFDEQGEVKL